MFSLASGCLQAAAMSLATWRQDTCPPKVVSRRFSTRLWV